ncbi:unnamed protein product [Periconia digitata]|uniref:Major facilitator superfamily (MFS) profile domain-containing protein n=1 Tax=Periconia digitata TaxID=1303443 RepID=A0A9W4XLS3_9PLEO|nr:unnamed protein product [Periconia digitata]
MVDYGTFGSGSNPSIPEQASADQTSVYSDDGVRPSSAVTTSENAAPNILQAPPLVAIMSQTCRSKTEARILRKIDTRLLPMIILMYIMNYLDRNNIAAVRFAGLQEELSLSSREYQTIVSVLFIGYLLMQVPSNLFLQKSGRPAIYLPTCMVIWGVISALTGTCRNFGGLVTCRFLLGFVEAAYFPGCLFYLSSWYTRKELGFRTAVLYSGSLLSGAFGGLVTAGITGNMDYSHGLRAWRWVFLIEGAITIAIALIAFSILPNLPHTTTSTSTSWLTEEERQLAIYRLQEDIASSSPSSTISSISPSKPTPFFKGFTIALSDQKTHLLTLLLTAQVSTASITLFFPTIVATLSLPPIQTLLLTSPPYLLAVLSTLLTARHADRTGSRVLPITLPLLLATFSFILAGSTTALVPRYIAMCVMVPGVYSGYPVALAWISNCIPHPPEKRAAALAWVNAVANASSVFASFLYEQPPEGGQPDLTRPLAVDCATALVAVAAAFAVRRVLRREGRRVVEG